MIGRFTMIGLTLVLATATVEAAEFPARPAPAPASWTGFYIGGHGGYGWGQWDGKLVYDPGTGPVDLWDPAERSIDGNGWFAGGQIGFNHQIGRVVLGVEADASWANLKGDETFVLDLVPDGPTDYTWTIANKLEVFGTVRGRLGFTLTPSLLLYGTGGLAWGITKGDLKVNCMEAQCFVPGGVVTAVGSARENHIGWAAGAGSEWAFAGNWSLKAEWLYVDLGDADYRLVGTAYPGRPGAFPHTTDSFPAALKFHTVRGGLNLKF